MSRHQTSRVSGFLWLALLLLTPALSFAGIVGQGTVVGEGSGKGFVVAGGDRVEGGHWRLTPRADTQWVKGGEKYDLIMVSGSGRRNQLFITFTGDDQHRDLGTTTLRNIDTVVTGLGNNETIREGDTVQISTQPADDGRGVYVTLELFRGSKTLGTFSFVQK